MFCPRVVPPRAVQGAYSSPDLPVTTDTWVYGGRHLLHTETTGWGTSVTEGSLGLRVSPTQTQSLWFCEDGVLSKVRKVQDTGPKGPTEGTNTFSPNPLGSGRWTWVLVTEVGVCLTLVWGSSPGRGV